ncbi:MAG: hypothetical protein HKP41_04430, partial [Desulfobacterales bacterium]|nr:hypothetical protein [Desulfobacterales bacterium]
MKKIFYPKSVAVIGVSPNPRNLGRNIVLNLIDFGFDGIVYAVGANGGMFATRRIYKSLLDIPDHVDLAVILVPARFVPDVLEECGQKSVQRAIIETAGFSEYSEEGRALEVQIVAIAEKYGIRFTGPNSIGAINMENGFCVPFARLEPQSHVGSVSMISQSGGVGMSIMNHMAKEGIGLNKFVSIGNALDTSAEDMLEYLIEDDGTQIIFMYLEGINDGRRLMKLAKRSPKPVLVFKSNVGKLGHNIAASHTGALSSDDQVVEAAFHQCGITRVHDVTTLSNYMKTLRLPPLTGNRLAIISRSGGHAIIAADACEKTGFTLSEFPKEFIQEIEKHFRASVIKLTNPLDLGDILDLDVYRRIVSETLIRENVDGVVFLHTSVDKTERDNNAKLIGSLARMCQEQNKPIAIYLSAGVDEIDSLMEQFNFPIFTRIVETFQALKLSYDHSQIIAGTRRKDDPTIFSVNNSRVNELLEQGLSDKRNLLLHEAMEVLEQYGVPTVRSAIATSGMEAKNVAENVGYPVAMKLISEDVLHKSDVGGVELNLRGGSTVEQAYDKMMARIHESYPKAKLDGVMIQPMVAGGRE